MKTPDTLGSFKRRTRNFIGQKSSRQGRARLRFVATPRVFTGFGRTRRPRATAITNLWPRRNPGAVTTIVLLIRSTDGYTRHTAGELKLQWQ